MTISLETGRLLLQAPDLEDAVDVMVLANNPRVTAMLASMPFPYRFSDALAWIRFARASHAGRSRRGFGIYLKARRPEFIGSCGVGPFGADSEPHLGYWIGEPHWGRGYAQEAARAVLTHSFAALALPAIHSGARPDNPASRAILQKLGFRHRGAGSVYSTARRRIEIVDLFRLDAVEWK